MILSSLARAHDRLPNKAPTGYASQQISALISLTREGTLVDIIDLRATAGKKSVARALQVPQPVKRTVGIAPNFLWDKTSYALGVTAGENKRTDREHEAFLERHADWLADAHDPGLVALRTFLTMWRPEQFEALQRNALLDHNVIFGLEEERQSHVYIHDRPAAHALWSRLSAGEGKSQRCLVTGAMAPTARLHPSIKGVWGAQSSGASIVSFNLDAFESYGHAQGDNAPVSEAAVSAYTGALNTFLAEGSKNRIQIGDSSTVFWADSSNAAAAERAQSVFAQFCDGDAQDLDDGLEAKKVRAILEAIREGRPLEDFDPELSTGVRFNVLGLAPNAARISIRFWHTDTFGNIAKNYSRFVSDMAIDPPPHDPYPPLWRVLREIAVQGKSENVPPNLAGAWMRSILTGAPYPQSLFATALMRVRADQHVNALRAAIIKAVLTRNDKTKSKDEEQDNRLMSRNPESQNKAYQLGRLFAVIEAAQYAALGRVNASIADRYYAAASATPARVFGTLLRGLRTHVSDARKRGQGGWIDHRVGEIMAKLPPELPKTLNLEDQGRFAVGYYHERTHRPEKPADPKEPQQ